MKNRLLYRIIPFCAALLLVCGLIMFACSGNAQVCAALRSGSLIFSQLWGFLWGALPIPAPELVYIALPIFAGWLIYRVLWQKKSAALWIISTPFILFFMYIMLFGIHYTAPPLSRELGLEVQEYSVEDLADTLEKLIQEMNIYAVQLKRDQSNQLIFQDFEQSVASVSEGYEALTGRYDAFRRVVNAPKPKAPLFSSKIMSYVGIAGYYFPFTATPMVSIDNTPTQLPYNLAHEWAHAGGIGPEDECNFAAFLACSASNDPFLDYSAAFNGYIYVGNALFAADPNRMIELMSGLNPLCIIDIRALNKHLKQYETPIADVGNAINDAYIKATGQPEGLKSYGKMVDLLISYYKQK